MLRAFMTSEDPMDELTRFMALCFSDLKKYKFVHWFAFPSLVGRPSWQFAAGRQGQQEQYNGWRRAVDVFGSEQVRALSCMSAPCCKVDKYPEPLNQKRSTYSHQRFENGELS